MTYKIFGIITAAVIFASCSSAYRSSQTPDDVYYSPAKPGVYAKERNNQNDRYDDYVSSTEDRYLRMKVQNRARWSSIDDFDYWYNPAFAFNNYYGSYGSFNPYFNNNWYSASYYNPYMSFGSFGNVGWYGAYYPNYGFGYYTPIYVVKNPTRPDPGVSRPSLRGYNNSNYNNTNTERQGLGSLMRKAFTPAYNNSNNNNNRYTNPVNNVRGNNNNTYTPERQQQPVRTYNPAPSSSSGSSSSGGSSGTPVVRPPRN